MSTTSPEEPTPTVPGAQATQPTVQLPAAPAAPQFAPAAQQPDYSQQQDYSAQVDYSQQAAYAPQQGFEAQGTQYPYSAPVPAATTLKDTNAFALVSVIVTFLMPLAGIIFGHMALNQIKRTGDAGRGLALTAVVYGYVMFALGLLFIITYIGFIAVAIGSIASGSSYLS